MSEDGCKLFVYGVGPKATVTQMKKEFGNAGTVNDAYNTGNGYAFITMSTYEEAIAAKKQFQGSECLGGVLKIDLSSRGAGGGSGGPPMPKRPAQTGGGDGGHGGGGYRGHGGGYGGNSAGGGRSNACFKCGKDGHKSFECPQGAGAQRGGGNGGFF